MNKLSLSFFLGIIFLSSVYAQQKDEVLLTIDKSNIYASEFKRVYLKNIDLVKDQSQKDVDEYLELFINYKLKLVEAKELGLNKKESYLKELEGYKKQLSSGYLTDIEASEILVKEAYDHLQERVNASHILISLKPNAIPKDTLLAYQKITEARNKIIKGQSFEAVAKEYSQDPSVVNNNGDLGWFVAFKMVYPFEKAAYQTKIGEISQPFRTQFGYHIVKVNAREKVLGEVTVSHIMVASGKERTEEEAEERITDINQQLKQGAVFESLAKQYSDDRNTAVNDGKINRFGQGALNSIEFEKAAFNLQTPGELSTPIKTKYGWHIIKLIEKHPPESFEKQKEELTKRVKRDGRSKSVTKSFINTLKKKYSVTRNEEAIVYIKKIIPDTMLTKEWKTPEDENLKKVLFKLKQTEFRYEDFVNYLQRVKYKRKNYTDTNTFIEEQYSDFESSTLLEYYEEHLEEDNEDFANIFVEYKEGLLLFDLMDTKIWNAAKEDSIGLKKFYNANKNNYTQKESYQTFKASSSSREAIEKVKNLLEKGKSVEEIKKEASVVNSISVLFSEEELTKGDEILPKNFLAKTGEIIITNDNDYFTLLQVKKILPPKIKSFEETKGKVINDFQESIEKTWVKDLREKHQVKINKRMLAKIKKELSK